LTRYVGLADETAYGTAVTPPATFLDAKRCTMHPEREGMKCEGMANLGSSGGQLGSYKIVGEIEIIPTSDNIAKLLKWMFGTPSTTNDGSTHYKHVYMPSDTKKWGTVYLMPDIDTDAQQFISCIPIDWTLEGALNEPTSAIFSMFGMKDTKVTATALGTLSSIRQFFSLDAVVTVDALTAQLQGFSVKYSRPIADDNYSMDDPYLKGFILGFPEVSGSIDMLFNDWGMYGKFWGATSAPIAKPAKATITITLTGDTLGGAGDYANHMMKVELPSVMIKAFESPVEMRDKIVQSTTLEPIRGTSGSDTTLIKVTLANALALP